MILSLMKVSINKCNTDETEIIIRKSDELQYCGNWATPEEERTRGGINQYKGTVMQATDLPIMTETKLERIAWLSVRNHQIEFSNLMHLYNMESLFGCFNELDGRKAVGEAGITKEVYINNLGYRNKKPLSIMPKRIYFLLSFGPPQLVFYNVRRLSFKSALL